MKRILPWKYSDCSPGCVLAMEVTLHLDCKFYWLCFLRGEKHGPRVAIIVASPGSTGTLGLGLFHLCFRPTFFRLFQRQCEYKLQLFVVLSVCLIMIAITRRVSAWYIACNQGKKNKSCGCCPWKTFFASVWSLYMTLSPGNISHEYPQNAILNSASGFINNERQTLYYNISDVGRCVIVDVMSGWIIDQTKHRSYAKLATC